MWTMRQSGRSPRVIERSPRTNNVAAADGFNAAVAASWNQSVNMFPKDISYGPSSSRIDFFKKPSNPFAEGLLTPTARQLQMHSRFSERPSDSASFVDIAAAAEHNTNNNNNNNSNLINNSIQIGSSEAAAKAEKLNCIQQRLNLHKNQKRAQILVSNLPSRMFKSLNRTKFDLLGDNSFYYDQSNQKPVSHLNQTTISINQSEFNHDKKNTSQQPQPPPRSLTSSAGPSTPRRNQFATMKRTRLALLCTSVSQRTRILVRKAQLFLKKVEESIPVIQPSSKTKITWDFLNMIVILISMFCLPVTATFDFSYSRILPEQILWILPNVLIIDVLLNFNTGFFDKGQVVQDHRKIIQNYIRKNIIYDILTLVPFIFTLYGDAAFHNGADDTDEFYQNSWNAWYATKLLKMLFFLKTGQITQILKKIEERFNISHRVTNLISLVKLLFTIILINHLFACLWVFVGLQQVNANSTPNWMGSINIQNEDWVSQYVSAYYFTTVTMITVGYGDILPKNSLEMMLCVITMMLACGVFGYSLNEVGQIFSSFFRVDTEIKQKIITIQHFMNSKNINSKLQYQVREYLEYYWREAAEQDIEQEQAIIGQLSESLRNKLLFEANKIALKDSLIFKHNFSKEVIESTVPLISEMKFSPESFIYQKHLQDDQAIFFIQKGSAEIILDSKNSRELKPLCTLAKGDSFGAFTFFTGLPRVNNVRAKEFTTVLKIKRADFLQLLAQNNHVLDLETFCDIRDSITLSNDFSKLGMRCYACSSLHHVVNDCKYLHFIPNKQRIIKLHNDALSVRTIDRESFKRRDISSNYTYRNSRSVYADVLEQAIMFIEDNYYEEDTDQEDQYSDGYYGFSSSTESSAEESGEDSDADDDTDKKEASPNSAEYQKIKRIVSSSTTTYRANSRRIVQELENGSECNEGNTVSIKTPTSPTMNNKEEVQYPIPLIPLSQIQSSGGGGDGSSASFSSLSAQKKPQKRKQSVSFSDRNINTHYQLKNHKNNTNSSTNHTITGLFAGDIKSTSIPVLPSTSHDKRGGFKEWKTKKTTTSESIGRSSTFVRNTVNMESLHHLNLHEESDTFQVDEKEKLKQKAAFKGTSSKVTNAYKFYDNICKPPSHTRRTSVYQEVTKSHVNRSMGGMSRMKLHQSNVNNNDNNMKMNKSKASESGQSLNQLDNYGMILKQLQILVLGQQQQQRYHEIEAQLENSQLLIQNQSDETDLFLHFDRMKVFQRYSPRYNYPTVISRVNFSNKRQDIRSKRNINNINNGTMLKHKGSRIMNTGMKDSEELMQSMTITTAGGLLLPTAANASDQHKASKFMPSTKNIRSHPKSIPNLTAGEIETYADLTIRRSGTLTALNGNQKKNPSPSHSKELQQQYMEPASKETSSITVTLANNETIAKGDFAGSSQLMLLLPNSPVGAVTLAASMTHTDQNKNEERIRNDDDDEDDDIERRDHTNNISAVFEKYIDPQQYMSELIAQDEELSYVLPNQFDMRPNNLALRLAMDGHFNYP